MDVDLHTANGNIKGIPTRLFHAKIGQCKFTEFYFTLTLDVNDSGIFDAQHSNNDIIALIGLDILRTTGKVIIDDYIARIDNFDFEKYIKRRRLNIDKAITLYNVINGKINIEDEQAILATQVRNKSDSR